MRLGRASYWMAAVFATMLFAGCDSVTSTRPSREPGFLRLALTLADKVAIDTISFTIDGPGDFEKSGSIAVPADDATFKTTVDDLPVGAAYQIRIAAEPADRSTSCAGTASFDISAGSTTSVSVRIRCRGVKRVGSVIVDGVFNICPVVNAVTAVATGTGTGFTLTAIGVDDDASPDPISYRWSASAGELSSANTANATLSCPSEGGDLQVSLEVSDGDCGETVTVARLTCESAGGTAGMAAAGSGGAGGDTGPIAGQAGQGADARSQPIAEGEDALIAAYPASSGIIVVSDSGVRLFDRTGVEIAHWDAPRLLKSAAFDGEILGVADGAILTGLNLMLMPVSSVQLIESCHSAVLLSRHRFICGPGNDWGRIFYTYDLAAGALLARSSMYTYNGLPMRRIPGSDSFVAVSTDSSPSDYHLYKLGADDVIVYVGESPYHGDFSVTGTYAFDGAPPTHLITPTGLLLSFASPGCAPGQSTAYTDCFVKDGALGTLTGNQSFIAMTNEGGTLYGLVNNRVGSDPAPSYLLQSIDVATRTLKTESVHALATTYVSVMAFDAVSGRVLLGYPVQSGDAWAPVVHGYRVELRTLD